MVADWSQAKIGYTSSPIHQARLEVADWSQAKIGYTDCGGVVAWISVADWSQAKIGYTGKQVERRTVTLRIGLRPRLVTLNPTGLQRTNR